MNPIIVNHPVILHKLTTIRKKTTNTKDFREHVDEISKLLAYEVLKNVKTRVINIETPIDKTTGLEISQDINLFPIMRAGLGMINGFQTLVPNSKVGHIGLYRDEKTLKPVEYLFKVPNGKNTKESLNILLDPILATGGSACKAIEMMQSKGFENIILVSILASQKGIDYVCKQFPNVKIYLVSIDKKLTDKGYITPGVGDAGDRMFGTK